MSEITKNQSRPVISLDAYIDLNDEFPSRKIIFHKFADTLRNKGYSVKETVTDVMNSNGRFEISFEYEGKRGKILTNTDPYSKMAILHSDLDLHINELIKIIEDNININIKSEK